MVLCCKTIVYMPSSVRGRKDFGLTLGRNANIFADKVSLRVTCEDSKQKVNAMTPLE